MSYPVGWNLVNITGTYVGRNGVPCVGSVTLSSPQLVLRSGTIVPAADIVFDLVNGVFAGQIPATDDPNAQPSGWVYTVTENVPGGRQGYQIVAPHASPGIDLSTVVPVTMPMPPTFGFPYVTLAQLAGTVAGDGAYLIGYQNPNTGAVASTVQLKLQELPSVKDMGAKGDGVTDDSAAFTLANTAFPFPGGYLVPPGIYKIGSNISITVPVMFLPGAILAPVTGKVVSLTSTVIAEDVQIFSNVNGGGFSLSNQAASCKAAWFGVSSLNTAAQNTANFNVLVASLPASNGCHVVFPAGQINTNGFSHSLSGVCIQGHQEGTWIINNSTNAFALESLGAGNFHNRFSDFRIGQATGVTPVAGNGGVHIQSEQGVVSGITCFQFPASLMDGFYFDGAIGIHCSNNTAESCLNNGFHYGNGTGDLMCFSQYSLTNAGNGFYFNGCSGVYLSTCSTFQNGSSAFYFDNTGHVNGSGTINEFVFCYCCIGDTSGSTNWNVLSLADSVFTGCWGCTQKSTSVNPLAVGFNVTGSGCNDITLQGCIAQRNNGDGIVIDSGATNIRLMNCEVRTNGLSVSAGNQNGIVIGYGSLVTNIQVIGCRVRGHANDGILLNAFASDYLQVASCNTQGNTGTGLVNNATGTHNQIGTGANV